MRYISYIDGSDSVKLRLDEADYLDVVVHDTATGVDSHENALALESEDVIGVGLAGCILAVARHTIKTATLHNHIVSVSTVHSSVRHVFHDADYAVVSVDSLIQWCNGRDDHKSISINNMDDSPEAVGFLGSAVYYVEHGTLDGRVCTLYDYLVRLSRVLGKNLFSYKTIHMYSDVCNTSVVIKLAESAEATRFFTKAYLDVMSGS